MLASTTVALLTLFLSIIDVTASPILLPRDDNNGPFTIVLHLGKDFRATSGRTEIGNTGASHPWGDLATDAVNKNIVILGLGELDTPSDGTDKAPITRQIMFYMGSYQLVATKEFINVHGICTMQLLNSTKKMNGTADFTLSDADITKSLRSKQALFQMSADERVSFYCSIENS